jgi:hypothetical protein
MTLFQNLILFTNHYGNLQEMLEMASFLKYVDLHLTSEWGRFYVGHIVLNVQRLQLHVTWRRDTKDGIVTLSYSLRAGPVYRKYVAIVRHYLAFNMNNRRFETSTINA